MNGFQALANAIVQQAAEDYRSALKLNDKRQMHELERFFRSAWYSALTDIDGEWLMNKLREEML